MGCETIIQTFFHMNLNIKLYHWQTSSYSRHKASDELHTELLELIDSFIEVYMGRYSRPEFKTNFDINVASYTQNREEYHIINLIKEYINYLKYDLPKKLNDKDTDLLNIRDEMIALFNQTLYLFTLN